jgi:hypothetical protein
MTKALFMAIYINNITLYGPHSLIMKNVKNIPKSKFEVMDLENLYWLLGIQIMVRINGIEVVQIAYIDSILSRFGVKTRI